MEDHKIIKDVFVNCLFEMLKGDQYVDLCEQILVCMSRYLKM